MADNRIEELLDELFDAVSDLHHYLGGMLNDMKNKQYKIDEASGDMAVIDNCGIGDILNELYELSENSEDDVYEQTTEELPVTLDASADIWAHYATKGTK